MTPPTTPDAEMPDELPLTEAEVLDIMQQFDMGGSGAIHEIDFRKMINQASLAVKLSRPSPSVERMLPISEEELCALIKEAWKKAKPSHEAQLGRSQASHSFDSEKAQEWLSDYLPDYIWDICDIAAQFAIDAKLKQIGGAG